MMSMNMLIAGFDTPEIDSLNNFRQLADALARPGKIINLPKLIGPEGLHKTSFSALLTLLDAKSSLFLSDEYRVDAVQKNFVFHCNCPCEVAPENADFALLNGASSVDMTQFMAGTARDPHRSTTLIIEIEQLAEGRCERCDTKLVLSGPGIQTENTVSLQGLDTSVINYLLQPIHAFPMGLDIFLTTRDKVMAIPRTTYVTQVEA